MGCYDMVQSKHDDGGGVDARRDEMPTVYRISRVYRVRIHFPSYNSLVDVLLCYTSVFGVHVAFDWRLT